MEDSKLESLLAQLKPICYAQEGKADKSLFRNKVELLQILRKAVPSLDDFYNETKNKTQSKKISNSSEKITL